MRAYIRVYKLKITITFHSRGRLFNLSVEWIVVGPHPLQNFGWGPHPFRFAYRKILWQQNFCL